MAGVGEGRREVHFMVPGPLEQTTGGYRYDRHVVDGLGTRGWTVTVHALPGPYPRVDESAILAADIALSRVPDGTPVIVDGLALPGLAAALALESHRLRLVAMVHHPLWLETGLDVREAAALRNLEQAALGRMRRIVVPSPRTLADVEALGLPGALIAVIPPGTARRPPVARPVRAEPRLLSVGIVTPRKGHLTLVAALAGLTALPWRLAVAGSLERDPAHAAAVRAAVSAAGLADRIAFAGETGEDALGALFADADLFVQASHHEGFGMALAEALAAGLPVVATRTGAAPDLVDAASGVLVAPDDVTALREALRPLLADPAGLRRLAAGARAAGEALPAWEDTVGRWDAVLRALTA